MPIGSTLVSIGGFIKKFVPKGFAIIFAIYLLVISASVALRDKDPGHFVLNGIGAVIAGADYEIGNAIAMLKTSGASIDAYLSILGGISLLYYMFRIIKWAMESSFPKDMNANFSIWLWVAIVMWLTLSLFSTAKAGEFVAGGQGVWELATNMDAVFAPVKVPLETAANISASTPFL